MQPQSAEAYWRQLGTVHDRVRQLHRAYLAARDALFAHCGLAHDEKIDELWRTYCDSIEQLRSAIADAQGTADRDLLSD